MLVFGHTHKPWVHEYGGVLFVNAGSIGKPKDGDPRACFAVLESDDRRTSRVTIERVAYDAEAVAAKMREVGFRTPLARFAGPSLARRRSAFRAQISACTRCR